MVIAKLLLQSTGYKWQFAWLSQGKVNSPFSLKFAGHR